MYLFGRKIFFNWYERERERERERNISRSAAIAFWQTRKFDIRDCTSAVYADS